MSKKQNSNYLTKAVLYYEKYLSELGQPKGCTEKEILELERLMCASLPEAYKEYLSWMGKDLSGIFCGSNCFIDDVVENTSELKELLEENNVKYDIPERYLVFYMHQGYIAFWFSLEGDCQDPVCFGYSEGERKNHPRNLEKFSTFMTEIIIEAIDNRLKLLRKKKKQWWGLW